MIACDFAYYRPETLEELDKATSRAGGGCLFYGGGSEIITMARAGSIAPRAVIDLKGIAQLKEMRIKNGELVIGACATLSAIGEANIFPLLSATVSRIADHTNQCRITIGGNVAGTIVYREAALPLMLADSTVTFWKSGSTRTEPFAKAFQKRLVRAPDEAILDFRVPEKYLTLPWAHAKRTRGDKIDYPVVTIAAMKTCGGLRFALSGATDYPFRDTELEKIFSDTSKSADVRADEIAQKLPRAPASDILASPDWRTFQIKRAIIEAIGRLENAPC